MLSRGHNHPVLCACGFCQPRNRTNNSQVTSDLFSVEGRRHSYTVPIPCPICGDAVFLYQSEHGGRAFFDELGPPWPKHPCTDRARAVQPTASVATDRLLPSRRYAWQEAGWLPVTDVRVEPAGSDRVRLRGKHDSQLLTIDIPITSGVFGTDPVAELANSPIHARRTVDGAYELAFLTQDLKHGLIRSFARPPESP